MDPEKVRVPGMEDTGLLRPTGVDGLVGLPVLAARGLRHVAAHAQHGVKERKEAPGAEGPEVLPLTSRRENGPAVKRLEQLNDLLLFAQIFREISAKPHEVNLHTSQFFAQPIETRNHLVVRFLDDPSVI